MEYEDSIQVEELCYRVREVELGEEKFDSYTAEAVLKTWNNGKVTVDDFKQRPPGI